MKKIILLILSLIIQQQSQAQQAIISMPATNVIYVGLDNSVSIAVNGYKSNQLKITTKGCRLVGEPIHGIIKADSVGRCLIEISLKTGKKIGSQTIRVKNIPKPEALFGSLESGYYPTNTVLAQNNLRAVWPNMVYEGISFTVISYQWTFVGNTIFNTCMEKEKGSQISKKLKEYIRNSKQGDGIIIDQIYGIGPGGIKMQLTPIEISISEKSPSILLNKFLLYSLNNIGSEITFHKFGDTIFCCNSDGTLPNGILKKYDLSLGDTCLQYELKYEHQKIKWIKEYYKNRNLKHLYNFELNDTIGEASSYYENGVIKATGKVMADISNLSKQNFYESFESDTILKILDSFLFLNLLPIGPWKGYYPDETLAFECRIVLKGFSIPYENGGSISDGEAEYSVSEVFKFKKTMLHPALAGHCKIFDRNGKQLHSEFY